MFFKFFILKVNRERQRDRVTTLKKMSSWYLYTIFKTKFDFNILRLLLKKEYFISLSNVLPQKLTASHPLLENCWNPCQTSRTNLWFLGVLS